MALKTRPLSRYGSFLVWTYSAAILFKNNFMSSFSGSGVSSLFRLIFCNIILRLPTFFLSWDSSSVHLLDLDYISGCHLTGWGNMTIPPMLGFWFHTLQVSSSGSPHIIAIEDDKYFLMQSLMDILCSVEMGSPFANLTINLFTRIKPFLLSSILVRQKRNKWSGSK